MKWIILHLFLSSMCFSCCLFPLLPPHTHWQPLPSYQMPTQPCKLAAWSYIVLAFSFLCRNILSLCLSVSLLLSLSLSRAHTHTHTRPHTPHWSTLNIFPSFSCMSHGFSDSSRLQCACDTGCWSASPAYSVPLACFLCGAMTICGSLKNCYKLMVNQAHVISFVTAKHDNQDCPVVSFSFFLFIIIIHAPAFSDRRMLLICSPATLPDLSGPGWHMFPTCAAYISYQALLEFVWKGSNST